MDRIPSMSRRDLLVGGSALAAASFLPSGAFAQGSDNLKVGLIGCGGRGTGAAYDMVNASKGVTIWSLGDVFEDRVRGSRASLEKDLKDNVKITNDRVFVGFDAFQKVVNSGVDVVILAAPPGFRPAHLKAAIDAGKHVFMEKPVATDGPGVRSVIASAELAKQKKLNIVAGTQRRHDVAYREAMKRIHGGDIGEITALYAYWNQGGLWMNPRQPGWTDMEWQLRNWLYFTWLSGDIITEQHIHNIDVCNWAMQQHPVKAICLGGRQVRTDPAYGHVFDHFATEYEYANGVKMISMCRQIDGTSARVSEDIAGTKGRTNANTVIRGEKAWRWEGDRPNPYVEEHKHLLEAIRGGTYINEGVQVAESTLTAIMGRMAGYTGKEVTWEQALNSNVSLVPEKLAFGPIEVPPVAMPGKTA